MKVHVTVDESIYPELHELMETTPVSKRARVLANLAFKACLLSNAALMNNDITAPPRGRGSNSKKKNIINKERVGRGDIRSNKAVTEDQSMPCGKPEDKASDNGEIEHKIKLDINEKTPLAKVSTSENTFSDVNTLEPTSSSDTGVLDSDVRNGGAFDQQNNAGGERSANNTLQMPKPRRRRILD